MALNFDVPVSGVLTALLEEPYEIKDRDTGAIERGVSRRVWVAPGLGSPPVELRVRQTEEARQMFERLQEIGWLGQVELVGRVSEFGGKASLHLIDVRG